MQPQPRKRNRAGLAIGIAVAACVIAAIAVFAFANPFAKRGVDIKEAFTDTSLVELVTRYDADEDGQLAAEEIEQVRDLDLSGTSVASLEGIQYLTALSAINVSNCMNLTTITLPDLPQLETLDARGSGVTTLQASECPSLNNLQVDDKVVVEGMANTGLKEDWLLVGFQYTSDYAVSDFENTSYSPIVGNLEAGYDEQNRIISLTNTVESKGDTQTNTITYQYDSEDRLMAMTNARGETTSFTYDEKGRALVGADGAYPAALLPMAYQYGTSDVVESTNNGDKMTISDGLIIKRDRSLIWTFSYDEKRRVTECAPEYGRETLYRYDDRGNVIQIDESADTAYPHIDDFSYDDEGNITAASRTYTKSMAKVTADMKFDEHGNVVSRTFTYPNGVTCTATFTYKRVFTNASAGEPTNVFKLTNPLEAPEVMAVPGPTAFPDSPRLAAKDAWMSSTMRK